MLGLVVIFADRSRLIAPLGTIGLVKHLPIIRLCIQKLRVFIESADQNQKYLGLFALGNIMAVHPKGDETFFFRLFSF